LFIYFSSFQCIWLCGMWLPIFWKKKLRDHHQKKINFTIYQKKKHQRLQLNNYPLERNTITKSSTIPLTNQPVTSYCLLLFLHILPLVNLKTKVNRQWYRFAKISWCGKDSLSKYLVFDCKSILPFRLPYLKNNKNVLVQSVRHRNGFHHCFSVAGPGQWSEHIHFHLINI